MSEAQTVLAARDLSRHYSVSQGFGKPKATVRALNGVSFELQQGKTLAIVGESGCGKSTLARQLTLIEAPTGGELNINGAATTNLGKAALKHLRTEIQMVFQNPYASLNPRHTIGFQLAEPLSIHSKLGKAEKQEQVVDMMKRVGLRPEHVGRYPHMFSGGQRQRIAIARALALNPKVVVADESVSALDVSIQAQIVNLMLDLQRELGVAFLFISHDMAVVERISHRVAVMFLGQIVEIGPRRAIFENPQHPYTKKLMAAVPIADPARRHLKRVLLEGEIPSPIRAVGDEPTVLPMIEVGPGHFVAAPV